MKILTLDSKSMSNALTMPEAISALRCALTPSDGVFSQVPARTIMNLSSCLDSNQLLVMPAALSSIQSLAVKVSTITPENKNIGKPLIHAVVILINTKTGEIQAIMEGAYLTALRTGAMAGLATDLLAPPDSKVLSIIGAGTQARTQIEAVCSVRPIEKIFIYSKTPSKAEILFEWVKKRGLCKNVILSDSASKAVKTANVVCTATSTSSNIPILRASDISLGTHINAIGGTNEYALEIDPDLFRSADVFVEDYDASIKEAGEIIQGLLLGVIKENEIIDIKSLLTNPYERSVKKTTVFKSVGIAIQDVVIASAIFLAARKTGLGDVVSL
ncbi:ornithine cyclodeaminase family protein [Pantoea sp. B566]|uniref:ornithine cyclodeaminase family protein n=1 Tax=Pantoea TaxID=53335 RepID=UPI0019081BC9|nr:MULTISPECIES: ornithine cyclodeaminase family protein [Pantoea]MCS3404399.1 ornithine cyclodeaminase family protein [Pantoea sp. B566]